MFININNQFTVDESEIRLNYVQSSGPGGQKVNKTASKAQLRFNVQSSTMPERVRARLVVIAGKRINEQGELVIESERYRTQGQNREDAIRKLISLLHQASKEPKTRVRTRPTAAARQNRLETKKRQGEIKRLRKRLSYYNEE